jgi:hypothetical protein
MFGSSATGDGPSVHRKLSSCSRTTLYPCAGRPAAVTGRTTTRTVLGRDAGVGRGEAVGPACVRECGGDDVGLALVRECRGDGVRVVDARALDAKALDVAVPAVGSARVDEILVEVMPVEVTAA